MGLTGFVSDPPGRCHGDPLHSDPVSPKAAPLKVGCHAASNLPGVPLESGPGRELDAAEQNLILGAEPRARLCLARESLRYHTRPRSGQGDAVP